jgi:(p)ppGpp synthase/HD superfamily hydrolase
MNAIEFAVAAHGDQRYGDGRPYATHLAETVDVLCQFWELFSRVDYTMITDAAWLHDTLEDTHTTLGEIDALFGPRVAQLVSAVTNNYAIRDMHERSLNAYAKIRSTGRLAVALKLADRIANVRNSHAGDRFATRYVADFRDFVRALYHADDKLGPMWDVLTQLIAERSERPAPPTPSTPGSPDRA